MAEDKTSCIYHGHRLPSKPSLQTTFMKDSMFVFAKVKECLDKRFKGFIESDVISWMKIADPANWPKKDLDKYGCSEVSKLTDHFRTVLEANGCAVDEIMDEWQRLKRDVRANHKKMKCHELWESIISGKTERCSNILHIIKIVLTVPISTSHVERLFSRIKRILGDTRLSLNATTMVDLVRISAEGPPVDEFDPLPAVKQWRLSGCMLRRPNVKAYGPRKKSAEPESASSESESEEDTECTEELSLLDPEIEHSDSD